MTLVVFTRDFNRLISVENLTETKLKTFIGYVNINKNS